MEMNILVSEPASGMRALARETLKGNWLKGFLATIVYAAVLGVPPVILLNIFGNTVGEFVGNLYSLLVWGPFAYGYTLFCISLFRARQARLEQVFYGFEYFIKTLLLMVVIEIFTFLWTLLFVIPGIIAAYRYSQAFYILADNPEMGIMECISASKRMMVGNKFKLFCLQLSFIGWSFLAGIPVSIFHSLSSDSQTGMLISLISLLMFVPMLFVALYMSVAETCFYDIASGHLRPGVIEATAEVYGEEQNGGF